MLMDSKFCTVWLLSFAEEILQNEEYLNELDSATGDGEHGSNMASGMSALQKHFTVPQSADLGVFFENVGMAIINSVGGASGALYGTLFLRLSNMCDQRTSIDLINLEVAFSSALEGIMELGRVKPGDKTLLDALYPATVSLQKSVNEKEELHYALSKAMAAADEGCKSTFAMEARKGRGSYQGQRSIGHIDPGATSMALLFKTLSDTFSGISMRDNKNNVNGL